MSAPAGPGVPEFTLTAFHNDRVVPSGGTAIGTWLDLARRLLAAHPDRIRHALLLTDGRNEHERPEQLAASLTACEGVFTCDARGIGTACTDPGTGRVRLCRAVSDVDEMTLDVQSTRTAHVVRRREG